MNAGELKAIVEDFKQVKKAIVPVLITGGKTLRVERAESISAQIVAAKIIHGDYKGQDFYNNNKE